MKNLFGTLTLHDWFDDHDYHALNPDGTRSDRWKGRGPTTIYDGDHPITEWNWCNVCQWFHDDGTVCVPPKLPIG